MKIEIDNEDGESIRGYVLAPKSIATSEDVSLHDEIVDYVTDWANGEYPLGQVTITAHEETPHCYNFCVEIMSESEFRIVAAEHRRDSMEDR